jgi:hypothetical protein
MLVALTAGHLRLPILPTFFAGNILPRAPTLKTDNAAILHTQMPLNLRSPAFLPMPAPHKLRAGASAQPWRDLPANPRQC